MIDKRKLATVAVTLAVAFGTGYIMQNGGAVAGRVTDKPPSVIEVMPLPDEEAAAALAPLPVDIEMPNFGRKHATIHARRLAAIDTGIDAPTLSDARTPTPFQLACKTRLAAAAAPAAMIDLRLTAPCDGNARITVRHAGLTFADVTDGNGDYRVSVPAMSADGEVRISFNDGRDIAAAAPVAGIEDFARSAIVWTGGPGLYIHAFEFGAGYGDAGDVWAGAPRGPKAVSAAKGGFLTRLGSEAVLHPTLAEVYSFPLSRVRRHGAVRLMVEAELNASTCGKTLTGTSIELGQDGKTRQIGLDLPLPDCDAGGGYLVLKNLLQDMKIARN